MSNAIRISKNEKQGTQESVGIGHRQRWVMTKPGIGMWWRAEQTLRIAYNDWYRGANADGDMNNVEMRKLKFTNYMSERIQQCIEALDTWAKDTENGLKWGDEGWTHKSRRNVHNESLNFLREMRAVVSWRTRYPTVTFLGSRTQSPYNESICAYTKSPPPSMARWKQLIKAIPEVMTVHLKMAEPIEAKVNDLISDIQSRSRLESSKKDIKWWEERTESKEQEFVEKFGGDLDNLDASSLMTDEWNRQQSEIDEWLTTMPECLKEKRTDGTVSITLQAASRRYATHRQQIARINSCIKDLLYNRKQVKDRTMRLAKLTESLVEKGVIDAPDTGGEEE